MSTDHNFWREKRAEADSNRGLSAYQPNALPLGQTGSQSKLDESVFLNRVSYRGLRRGGRNWEPLEVVTVRVVMQTSRHLHHRPDGRKWQPPEVVTICAVMQTSQSLHHSPDAWVSRCTPVTCHRVTRYTLQSVTGSHPPPLPPSPPPVWVKR